MAEDEAKPEKQTPESAADPQASGEAAQPETEAAPAAEEFFEAEDPGDRPREAAEPIRQAAWVADDPMLAKRRRFRLIHAVVALNTVVVLAVAALLVWRGRGGAPVPQRAGAAPATVANASAPAPAPVRPQRMSWLQAENAFAQRRFGVALRGYTHLHAEMAAIPSEAAVSAFLNFRRAQCLEQLGRAEPARALLLELTEVPWPVLRASALYRLAVRDIRGGQHLHARTKAYLALASLGAMSRRLPLETDCDFLIGRALTEAALFLHGKESRIAWRDARWDDPFGGVTEDALRALLDDGVERAGRAVLRPRITKRRDDDLRADWTVACRRTPLSELLDAFGGRAGLEVDYSGVTAEVRQRAVTFTATDVSTSRLIELACGAAGLIGRFTGRAVLVSDPVQADTLSAKQALLDNEAMACWRRLFLRLRGSDDDRVPVGHFALGRVLEGRGDPLAAMDEYQLAAGLFRTDTIAPECLLRSAVLRMELGNYEGARDDLHDLLYRYPSFQGHDRAYLALGEANLRAGRHQDAIADFRRLYYLNISSPSQAGAAIGLGRCYFEFGAYDEAAKWLTRYVGLAETGAADVDGTLPEAHVMLGESHAALDDATQAEADFRRALAADPSRAQRDRALFGLAELCMKAGRYAEALRAAGVVEADALAPEPLTRYLVLIGRLYRAIGLPDKGAYVLRDRLAAVSDEAGRARVAVEIGRSYLAAADYEKAAGVYAEAIRKLPPGRECQSVTCELAELCLKLGRTGQAITLAGGVLDGSCERELRSRVAGILGSAYVLRGEYDKAAQAFALGREDGVAAADADEGRQMP